MSGGSGGQRPGRGRRGGQLGALANERRQRFKHCLMVLVGIVHHPFERIDAAKPDDDGIFITQLFEALRNLIADQEVMRRLLLLQKLQIRQAGAEQDHDTAERLPDGLPIVVLDVRAVLWLG